MLATERGCDLFVPRRTLLAPPAKSSKKVSGLPVSLRRNPPGVAVIELHRATNKCCPSVYLYSTVYYVLYIYIPGCARCNYFLAFATSRGKGLAGHAKHTPPLLYCPQRASRMWSPESLYWPTSSLRVPLHRYPPLVNTGRNLLLEAQTRNCPDAKRHSCSGQLDEESPR